MVVDNDRLVSGWISRIRKYDGHSWELHRLVAKPFFRNQGIGKALVAAFEEQERELGGTTIYLGTDDENYRRTISGIDLYPDVLEKLFKI